MGLREQVRSKVYMDEIFNDLGLGERSRYGINEFNELGELIGVDFVGGVGTAEAIRNKLNEAPVQVGQTAFALTFNAGGEIVSGTIEDTHTDNGVSLVLGDTNDGYLDVVFGFENIQEFDFLRIVYSADLDDQSIGQIFETYTYDPYLSGNFFTLGGAYNLSIDTAGFITVDIPRVAFDNKFTVGATLGFNMYLALPAADPVGRLRIDYLAFI